MGRRVFCENDSNPKKKKNIVGVVVTGSTTLTKSSSREYNKIYGAVHVSEKGGEGGERYRGGCTIVQVESTVDQWLQADGHLDTFFAFAFHHTSHGNGRHPQDLFPFRKSQLKVFEQFDN